MDNASAFSQVLRFLEEGLADLVSNIPEFRRREITELRLRTGPAAVGGIRLQTASFYLYAGS